jgi:transposase
MESSGFSTMTELEQPWRDEEWLRKEYHDKEKTQKEVAKTAGCSISTVKRWMKRFEIPRRSLSEAHAEGDIAKLRDREWLYEHYYGKDMSARQIAQKINSNNDSVLGWLDRHGIERKHRSEVMSDGDVQKLHDKAWLQREYVEKERDAPDIADECDVDNMTVYNWLDKHEISTRPQSVAMSNGDVEKLSDSKWLKEKYADEGLSTREIGEDLNVSKGTVLRWLRKHQIEIDDVSPSGADNKQWDPDSINEFGRNWLQQRLRARIRDQARCQVCGITDSECIRKYGMRNDVHHIISRSEYYNDDGTLDYEKANRLSNLITLCRKHHQQREEIPIDSRNL